MKYRSRMDIIAMVIRASKNGSSKTHIMYDAYLSYTQVKEYLSFLTERELLKYNSENGKYTPTQNGARLLETYEGISDLISVKPRAGSPTPVSAPPTPEPV